MEINGWLPLPEAARNILGVTPQRLHQLIGKYGLKVERINPRLTMVKRREVEKLAAMERPSGVHIERRRA